MVDPVSLRGRVSELISCLPDEVGALDLRKVIDRAIDEARPPEPAEGVVVSVPVGEPWTKSAPVLLRRSGATWTVVYAGGAPTPSPGGAHAWRCQGGMLAWGRVCEHALPGVPLVLTPVPLRPAPAGAGTPNERWTWWHGMLTIQTAADREFPWLTGGPPDKLQAVARPTAREWGELGAVALAMREVLLARGSS